MQAIVLEDYPFTSITSEVLGTYKTAAAEGKVGDNHTRSADFRRWNYMLSVIGNGNGVLDVGSGVGQLVHMFAMSGKFSSVTASDRSKNSKYLDAENTGFEEIDLSRSYDGPKYDVVTCLECIEHIRDPGFEIAVRNLTKMYKKELYVSVPFMEPEPLSTGHFQRFDENRILSLFPKASVSLLIHKRVTHWALISIKH